MSVKSVGVCQFCQCGECMWMSVSSVCDGFTCQWVSVSSSVSVVGVCTCQRVFVSSPVSAVGVCVSEGVSSPVSMMGVCISKRVSFIYLVNTSDISINQWVSVNMVGVCFSVGVCLLSCQQVRWVSVSVNDSLSCQ